MSRSSAVVRRPLFAFECGAAAETVDVDFEDRGVMDEAIDSGERHGGVWKDLSPGAERLICRDQGRSAFVAGADQLEQDGGFRLILADIGEVIEDQQIEAVEPIDGRLQCQFAACHLKPLNQIGGSSEQHAAAVFHQCQADGGGQMRLAAAGSADQHQIGALVDPAVAGADRQDMRLGDHRHRVEVEAVEGFAWQQLRFGEMSRETAPVAFGDLVFGEGGEEARGGPAFLVRPLGEGGPTLLDRGQPEVVEHQRSRAVSMLWVMPRLPVGGPM